MAIARKIMRQRQTLYVSLAPEIVKAFGCTAGDMVLIEHPFSRAAIITPMDQGVLAPNTEAVRALGWLTERGGLDWLRHRWNVVAPGGDVSCQGCGFHKATERLREVHLCKWCTLEVVSGMQFRQRPSAPELQLGKDV